jgi:hypothetical protein
MSLVGEGEYAITKKGVIAHAAMELGPEFVSTYHIFPEREAVGKPELEMIID